MVVSLSKVISQATQFINLINLRLKLYSVNQKLYIIDIRNQINLLREYREF